MRWTHPQAIIDEDEVDTRLGSVTIPVLPGGWN